MKYIISILISITIAVAIVTLYVYLPFKFFGKRKSKEYIKEHKLTIIVYVLLRLIVSFTLVRSIYLHNYYNAFLCFVVLILFIAPMIVEKTLKIELPTLFEVIILLFIFSAEILGEIHSFYTIYLGWDTILHTLNGFLCAAIGFSLVDMMNRENRKDFNLSPFYLALTAFCFSMTIGVLWEFGEFAVDKFFIADSQKDFIVTQFATVNLNPYGLNNPVKITDIVRTVIETADGSSYVIEGGYLDIGIIDTMKDLFVNFIGAIVFSVIGFIYKRNEKKGKIAKNFLIKVIDE